MIPPSFLRRIAVLGAVVITPGSWLDGLGVLTGLCGRSFAVFVRLDEAIGGKVDDRNVDRRDGKSSVSSSLSVTMRRCPMLAVRSVSYGLLAFDMRHDAMPPIFSIQQTSICLQHRMAHTLCR